MMVGNRALTDQTTVGSPNHSADRSTKSTVFCETSFFWRIGILARATWILVLLDVFYIIFISRRTLPSIFQQQQQQHGASLSDRKTGLRHGGSRRQSRGRKYWICSAGNWMLFRLIETYLWMANEMEIWKSDGLRVLLMGSFVYVSLCHSLGWNDGKEWFISISNLMLVSR